MSIQSYIRLRMSIGFIKSLINCLIKVVDKRSFFTNVSLSKTINDIIDRVKKDTMIDTKLKKNMLKKLIKDCCSKSVFF